MGRIADKVLSMRGSSLREIAEAVAEMEADLGGAEPGEFDEFWKTYPYKTAKPAALKAYRAVRKRKYRHEEIMYGLHLYIQTKPRDRDWCMAATFLNQERFCDIEAMTKLSAQPKSVTDLFGAMAEHFDGQSREGTEERGNEAALRITSVHR